MGLVSKIGFVVCCRKEASFSRHLDSALDTESCTVLLEKHPPKICDDGVLGLGQPGQLQRLILGIEFIVGTYRSKYPS